jgi:DNA-directed RNA polymerase specialized sigma subunit
MNEKKRTVDQMKKEREVSAGLRERVKETAGIKKRIKLALEGKELTILEIAAETGINPEEVTYHLMTMRKFGEVEFVDDDDVDEYYSYRIKE